MDCLEAQPTRPPFASAKSHGCPGTCIVYVIFNSLFPSLFYMLTGCNELNITDPLVILRESGTMTNITKLSRAANTTVDMTCADGYYLSSGIYGQCKSWKIYPCYL